MREKVLNDVIEVACNLTGESAGAISEDTRLAEDLCMDSLDLLEFSLDLEKKFNITIPDEHCEEKETIGQVTDYIFERISNRS